MRKIMTQFMLMACMLCSPAFLVAGEEDGKKMSNSDKLKDPASATETAPETFKVKFETTKGAFTILVHREWAPLGVDRFYNLVKVGYFQDIAFYRVIEGFMAQFGSHGDPDINKKWMFSTVKDDPTTHSNLRGRITFANRGPNTRSNQFFINLVNNDYLDRMGFAAFGEILEDGMTVVDQLYADYGEGAPRGRGPHQGLLAKDGNKYLKEKFPELDYIKSATFVD